MERLAALAALAALAQETRLEIFRLIVGAGSGGLAPGRISEALGLPAPTLSFHLNQLKSAGLVMCRREGRSLIYGADFAAMSSLVSYLTENCCGSGSTLRLEHSPGLVPANSDKVEAIE